MAGRKRARRNWGSGTVWEKAPGRWAIRWRENGRRRARGGFATREDAENVLAVVLGRVALDDAGMPAPRSETAPLPTLSALAPAWLDRRKVTHRAAVEDGRRWRLHLAPHFGRLTAPEVTHAAIRRFAEERLAAGLAPGTVGVCVAVLSALFADLVERETDKPGSTGAIVNPCRGLPRSIRALFKSDHNPEDTPYVERLEDVRRVFLALPEPVSIAYALGAMAGLRTGEAVALRWEAVDLATRRITVRAAVDKDNGEQRAPKDGDTRVAPILDGLHPVLTAWKLKSGGRGLVVPPLQKTAAHLSRDVLWKSLREALKAVGYPESARKPGTDHTLTWYRATRHTFASHWVLAGGSLATLARILGHASVTITERHYVHLRPDAFSERDHGTIALDLRASAGAVAQLPGSGQPAENGHEMTTPAGASATK
jgi:integrase